MNPSSPTKLRGDAPVRKSEIKQTAASNKKDRNSGRLTFCVIGFVWIPD